MALLGPDRISAPRMLGATYGIYTLVGSRKGGEESVESFFEKAASGKLTEAAAEVGSGSKIRLGRWVAQETPCPKEIDQLYERLVERFVGRNTRCVGEPYA